MSKVIDKQCPGDCSKCTLAAEIPNFDFYGCVLHQIFQKTIKLEKDHAELAKLVYDSVGLREEKEQIFTNEHRLGGTENGIYDDELPEQKGQE